MSFVSLLYYKYIQVPDPAQELIAQRRLCESLGLLGRILLAHEGINGTVAGTPEATKAYIEAMDAHNLFTGIDYKSDPTETIPFTKLRIKVRDEIVTLGQAVDPAETAPKLTPDQFHDLVTANPDVVLFDARNNYESAIGRFRGAVTPNIKLFKDLPQALDDYPELKDKTVVTYCTGGIRCEKTSALMRKKGFKDVYQLEGGIIKYAQKYPNGEFLGKVFVFDQRMSVAYAKDPAQLGSCHFCAAPTNEYMNCANPSCNNLTLRCAICSDQVCSQACAKTLASI